MYTHSILEESHRTALEQKEKKKRKRVSMRGEKERESKNNKQNRNEHKREKNESSLKFQHSIKQNFTPNIVYQWNLLTKSV